MAEQQVPLFKRVISRRAFGRRLGVTGLAAAAAVAVNQGEADAHFYHYFCCHLYYAPTFPYSDCANGASYIWGCYSGSQFCRCCEKESQRKSSITCS